MLYILNEQTAPLGEEPFFTGISRETIERLNALAYHRSYEPRQIIYFPDDACDYVYWVRSGRVKVMRTSESGREITYRHLFPGDMFGEEGLVQSLRRNHYAEAVEPTLLTLLRQEDFGRIVREELDLAYAMACHLCRRAIEVETTFAEYVFVDVRTRVASRLWQLYWREQTTEDTPLLITHQEIASLAGAARETVTVALHALREAGIIALSNAQVHVLKPDELQRLANLR